jgi:hypothetical protein
MEPAVWIESQTPLSHLPRRGEVAVVCPLATYDADLGMRTRQDVYRQLTADVPRCEVWVEGVRATSVDDVWRRVAYPRMCTQAVLAPPVEWLMRHGWVAYEVGAPMVVECRGKSVEVRKRLGLMRWNGGSVSGSVSGGGGKCASGVDVRVTADAPHVVVTLCRYVTPARARSRP